jgi:hypothetical protein
MVHPVDVGLGGEAGVLIPLTIIVNGVPPGNSSMFEMVSTCYVLVKLMAPLN